MADYVSVLTGGTNNFATTSEHINALATDILSDGVVGTVANSTGIAPMTGGLAVNAQGTPNMTVAITAGKAYVTTTPSGQASQRLRANIAAQNVTIAANSTGGTRYDWVYVKIDAANAANPNAAGDNVASLVTSRSTSASTDNGTPPTYGYAIAVVTVSNGATSIVNGNITDVRSSIVVSNNATNDGWVNLSSTPDTVTNNGNRNFDLVFNSVDHSDVLSPGMKIKLTRTIAAPDQCTTLNGTSQYYNKTSPNKCTFTSTFSAMGWVKLSAYGQSAIIGRDSAAGTSSGWELNLNATGQVICYARNATGNIVGTSYASVPLNKWMHIAATLNASTGAIVIYFNGQVVQSTTTTAGTTIVQASTDLTIGKRNSVANYLNGKLAQVALFSAVLSQSTIQQYMTYGLTGSETSLVSAYSFDNSKTDLNTTTPNDLTANGSAVETTSDSPFANAVSAGLYEYAEINQVSYSTNTTVNVRVPDNCNIPVSGGISAVYYSTASNPYGMPYISKLLASSIINSQVATTSTTDVQANGLRLTFKPPTNAKLKITFFARNLYNTSTGRLVVATIYEGTVPSGQKWAEIWGGSQGMTAGYPITSGTGIIEYNVTSTSELTFNVGLRTDAGTAAMDGSLNASIYFIAEIA